MGDVVTGRPYTEGEGLPPVSERLKPHGHCQSRGLDTSETDDSEKLREVTLSGDGELRLATHSRIEVARGPPERGEGTALTGEIPYTRGDHTIRSGDPRHLPQPAHRISHEVHDQLGMREVETVIGKGKVSGCTAANVDPRQACPDCSHERGGGGDRRDRVGAQPVPASNTAIQTKEAI
jgi:hypothetical protein